MEETRIKEGKILLEKYITDINSKYPYSQTGFYITLFTDEKVLIDVGNTKDLMYIASIAKICFALYMLEYFEEHKISLESKMNKYSIDTYFVNQSTKRILKNEIVDFFVQEFLERININDFNKIKDLLERNIKNTNNLIEEEKKILVNEFNSIISEKPSFTFNELFDLMLGSSSNCALSVLIENIDVKNIHDSVQKRMDKILGIASLLTINNSYKEGKTKGWTIASLCEICKVFRIFVEKVKMDYPSLLSALRISGNTDIELISRVRNSYGKGGWYTSFPLKQEGFKQEAMESKYTWQDYDFVTMFCDLTYIPQRDVLVSYHVAIPHTEKDQGKEIIKSEGNKVLDMLESFLT